jgi:integrase
VRRAPGKTEPCQPGRSDAQKYTVLEDVRAIPSVASPRLQRILATLAFAGLRIGELRQLRVDDVDFTEGWIRVESREGAETKTHRSRKIPIHPVLREILEEQRSSGPWFFRTARSGVNPDDWSANRAEASASLEK